jgi:L-lactate dehydrogenase complex protein LldF
MKSTSHSFKDNAQKALSNERLQKSLRVIGRGFVEKRARARARLPEFDDLCDEAQKIKTHTLEYLDLYLQEYETKLVASGGHLHMASTAEDACDIILRICRDKKARNITKGKSMVAEEVGLNEHLEKAGLRVVETDLGEYIIQLRGEAPSHIVAPAVHVGADQVEDDFRRVHTHLPRDRDLPDPAALVAEARKVLREEFINADIGITGANFLIAQTGSSVIVTNEGNGDLTQSLAPVHIVITSIDKLVPTLNDASSLIRVLARSATGQPITTYTTFSTGPRRQDDPDGPLEYHVVLLDNGRSKMLGNEFSESLRCIRCGACMNHCPVYQAIGGHAYGWVYPGPIGSVLSPSFLGLQEAADLPNASTLCGRCEQVCPMSIPLPDLLRKWREKHYESGGPPVLMRTGLSAWALVARRPRLYQSVTGIMMPLLARLAGRNRIFRWLPLASGWTNSRDLPAPTGKTFMMLLKEQAENQKKKM